MIKNEECVISENDRLALKELLEGKIRGFTEDEAKKYYESLDKLYKPLVVDENKMNI